MVRRRQPEGMLTQFSCILMATILACTPLLGKVVELSSSVVMMGEEDYFVRGNTSACTDMVDRAALETNSRLNFIPTLFWVDRTYKPGDSTQTHSISYFCFHRSYNTDGTVSCQPAAQQDVDIFEHSMKACFRRAVEYNISIEVSPRLQHSSGHNVSSNSLDMNPLLEYEGFKYMDIMLMPLAHAINGAVNNKTEVWLSLQGQMGMSLFKYPMEYMQALGTTHLTLHDGLPHGWPHMLHLGVSLNFYKICGCILTEVADPNQYTELFPDAFKAVKHTLDFEVLHELFSRLDFISVAGLAPLSPGFSPGDLETTLQLFAKELGEFGIRLHHLLSKQRMALHWVDFGIGGLTHDGRSAVTAADAAQSAPFGVSGQYSQQSDPWSLHSVNSSETPVRSFLSYFYENTAEYFWKQHAYKYEVDAAYLYNYGSWDVQGIHPNSTSAEGSYQFAPVVNVIRYHNFRSQRLINLALTLGEPGIKFLIESRELQHKEPVTFASREHTEGLQVIRHSRTF